MNAKLFIYWIPALLGSLAVLCSAVGNFFCETIKFEPNEPIDSNSTSSEYGNTALFFGPWTYREVVVQTVTIGGEEKISTKNVCVYYDGNVPIDSKWKTTRAFSIITLVLGLFLSLGLWFVPCCGNRISDNQWKRTAIAHMVVLTLFQGLSFLWIMDGSACEPNTPLYGTPDDADLNTMLESYPDECEWAGGSTAMAISTGLFFLTGVAMMAVGTPKADPRPPPETQQVVYQQTTNPDGTTTVQQVDVIKGTEVEPPVEKPVGDLEAKVY